MLSIIVINRYFENKHDACVFVVMFFMSMYSFLFLLLCLQMYASQYFPQITELLRRLPRVILLMLKTNDCLRAVNRALVWIIYSFLDYDIILCLHIIIMQSTAIFLKLSVCVCDKLDT